MATAIFSRLAKVMDRRCGRLGVIAGVAAAMAPISHAFAEYPDRPIRLIVPFSVGSSVDMVARPLADGLTTLLSQQIVIENRPGGGSINGTAEVARAAPNGYTMLFVVGAHTSQPSLSNIPYDPIRDFAAVTQVAASCGLVLLVNDRVPAKSVSEFVALARKEPGKLSYATLGYGSSTHVAGALFGKAADINIVAVPYATSNLITDLIGNRVEMAFVSTVTAVAPIEAGLLRALAVTGPRRCSLLPNVPTLKELGYGEFDREGYFGVAFPAKTPDVIIDRIQKATVEVLKTPNMQKALKAAGLRQVGSTPKEFAALLQDDLAAQAKIFQRVGITKH